ncbi:MAG: hypothetical protein QOE82_2207, partial [Thermoanaerobaculia bacterium]|nr:hypothetical protein [Thermoanaerobaculia bacterium]
MQFYALTVNEVLQVVAKWQPKRAITAVHIHHTIAPSRDSFSGIADLERLASHHDSNRLPQHLTIDGTGLVWTGRHWELPPASIAGRNGTPAAGPFSIALAGDFNRENLDGAQRSTAIAVTAELLRRNKLSENDVVFHRDADAARDCPGARVDPAAFRAEVRLALVRPTPAAAPQRVAGPFSPQFSAVAALQEDLAASAGPFREPPAAEPQESILRDTVELTRGTASRDFTPPPPRKLDAEGINELLPHVINLTQGLLSDDGKFKTRPHQVDEMFARSIPDYIADCEAAGRTPRLMFFAHGGLNSEVGGLETALNQLEWWKRNHVYPVFFVWETGLLDAIHFLIRPKEGTRNFFSDHVSDPIIERTVHLIGGVQIWGNMKQAAERAGTHPLGGSNLVAQKLAALMTAKPSLEVHAIGHSAGAILHAHFLKALERHQAPRGVKTLNFFAPAITVEEFKNHVINRVGTPTGIDSLAVFAMRANLEEDDNCITIYRKSLLCLIRAGLEPERNTPLLGLEDSMGDDVVLRSFFGLGGAPGRADVIFSLTPTAAPPGRRCTATAHGAFDNNVDTMNSAALRILGARDGANLISFAESSAATRAFAFEDPMLALPEEVRLFLTGPAAQTPAPSPTIEVLRPANAVVASSGINRRRALCVGINDYGSQSLQFCVADAELWAQSLAQQGFTPTILTDGQATRERILGTLSDLVRDSVAGDTLVLQFAGHGTLLPDLNGDENKGVPDFAYVPFDFESGAFVLDDDVFAIWQELKQGVTATSFFDACHSGNGLRMLASAERMATAPRARFITVTVEQQRKHIAFRNARGFRGGDNRSAEIFGSAVFFGACAEHELALERDGHGDFTRFAAPEIASAARLTNRAFHERVVAAFGAAPAQTPQWDAAPDGRRAEIGEQPFLQPITPRLPIAASGG